jgi:hypothetical protein
MGLGAALLFGRYRREEGKTMTEPVRCTGLIFIECLVRSYGTSILEKKIQVFAIIFISILPLSKMNF